MTAYREAWSRLSALYGEREARSLTDLVLDVRFGLSKADVICGKLDGMSADELTELDKILARLEQAEPVQYVLGTAYFGGRTFTVRPGVLVPRPETEELCALVVAECGGMERQRLLDIGTGSGCIAVTLALDMPRSEVMAWDISPAALAVAKDNAARLGASVAFEERDALHLVTSEEGIWDIIVSNPPYICMKEQADMEPNVLEHEPHTALFVPDDDPLLFYRAITRYARRALSPCGRLYFEINPLYADDTVAMMRAEGFSRIALYEDEWGKRRMVAAAL